MRPRRVLHSPTAEPGAVRSRGLPRARGATARGRRRRERALARADRREPDGHRRWRDGHDAVRQRPDVRRPARGLEPVQARRHPPDPPRLPRRRVADPHDQHVRWQPDAAQPARSPGPRRRAQPDRRDPPAQRGRCGRWRRPGRRRHRAERGDPGPDRDARLRRGGRHLRRAGGRARRRRRRPHLDRDDVRPDRDQGRDRGRPPGVARDRADHDDDLRHPRPHDDGRLPGAGRRVVDRLGRRRRRGQLRQRPGRADHGHRADARGRPRRDPGRQVERGDARARRHAGRLPRRPRDDGDGGAGDARGGCLDHRRLLRQHARAPRRDREPRRG